MGMHLPARLKIGNLWYDIGELDRDAKESFFGRASHEEQYIRLSPKLSDDLRVETFWHEVIHQVMHHGHFHDESKNEKLVNCLSNGIYQVLKDNGFLKDG